MASFPKQECVPNCIQRVELVCDHLGRKPPTGDKAAKVQIECEKECVEINKNLSITHASDQFVSALADGACGPKGDGGKQKSQFYKVEIRGTNADGNSEGSGVKAIWVDRKIHFAEEGIKVFEMQRSNRTWYQSFSDLLGGPSFPSHLKTTPIENLVKQAKALRSQGDLEGARDLVDKALHMVRDANGELYSYQVESLNHADTVKWVHLGVSALLFVAGGGTALALSLGGAGATGAAVGGGEIISLTARLAARQGVQEALKRAAVVLFGLEASQLGEHQEK